MGAKTINVTNLSQPVGLSGVLVAGGSLAANTTYYYKVIACLTSTNNAYQMDAESIPSAEISITTDNTNLSVALSWTATPNANRYVILRTTVSGDYAFNTAHLVRPTASTTFHSTTSFTDTNTIALYNWEILDNGMPSVVVDGGADADRNTEDDVYNALVAAGLGAFCGKFSIYPGHAISYYFFCGLVFGYNSSNPTYFRWGGDRSFFLDGCWFSGQYANQVCGQVVGDDSYGYNGSAFLVAGKSGLSTRIGIAGTFKFYSCQFIDTSNSYYSNTSYWFTYRNGCQFLSLNGNGTETSKVYNCNIRATTGNAQLNGNIILKNCWLYYNVRIESNYPVSILNCNIVTNTCYSYGSRFQIIRNTKLINCSYEFQMHGDTGLKYFTYVDCDFYNNPPKCNTTTNPEKTKYIQRLSFILKVVDEAGSAVSGASVFLTDATGRNSVFIDSGTKLGGDVAVAGTSVLVLDGTKFALNDVIDIHEERMLVTNIVGNTLTVTRGYDGTEGSRGHYATMSQPIYKRAANLTTSASGTTTQIELVRAKYDYDPAPASPYKYATTLYAPFYLKIVKSGYKAYVSKFSLDKKFDQVITLSKVKDLNFSKKSVINT